jgi:hypothetical protein
LRALASNDVWELVNTPKRANIVSNKWGLKVKRLPNEQINRYKARLIARRFSQRHRIDYNETFAPIMRMKSLRILLAVAAAEYLKVYQINVVTAYLAEELEGKIYIAMP